MVHGVEGTAPHAQDSGPPEKACPHSSECHTQCDRVCLDDRLYGFVDRCCDCDDVCTLDTPEKATALVILGLCLL